MKNLRRALLSLFKILGLTLFLYLMLAFAWAYVVTPRIIRQVFEESPKAPQEFISILLRVEDPSFYSHPGIDPFTRGQGLTTLTQALTRMLLLSDQIRVKSAAGLFQRFFLAIQAKAHKIDIGRDAMALAFNLRCPKDRQLRLFLTHAYMGSVNGRQIYGISDAARIYYRTETDKLTHREIVGLIAMLIAPNEYHPIEHPLIHGERARRIERLLQNKCQPDGLLDTRLEGCR